MRKFILSLTSTALLASLGHAAEVDRAKRPIRDGKAKIEQPNWENLKKRIEGAVKRGDLTREQANQKYAEIKKNAGERPKRPQIQRGQQAPQQVRRQALQPILRQLIEAKKITGDDAARIMRAAMSHQPTPPRGEHRDERPQNRNHDEKRSEHGDKEHEHHDDEHHDDEHKHHGEEREHDDKEREHDERQHAHIEKMADELEHVLKEAKAELNALREAKAHLLENHHKHAQMEKTRAEGVSRMRKKHDNAVAVRNAQMNAAKANAEKEIAKHKAEAAKKANDAKAKHDAAKKHATEERKKFEELRKEAEKRARALMEKRKEMEKRQKELEEKRRKSDKKSKDKKEEHDHKKKDEKKKEPKGKEDTKKK